MPEAGPGAPEQAISGDDGRWYADPLDPERQYPAVGTIISASSSKPWLMNWAAKLAAEYAVDHADAVKAVLTSDEKIGRQLAIDLIKDAAKRMREAAADVGSHVHEVLEALVRDDTLEFVDEHIEPWITSFFAWWEDWQPTFEMVEATVCNPGHNYAGTLDGLARFPSLNNELVLVDYKSGKRVDMDVILQLIAYSRATEIWIGGRKIPMPQLDRAVVVHITPEEYAMWEVDITPDDIAQWDRVRTNYGWKPGKLRRLRPPLPDGTPAPAYVEDQDGLSRSWKKLAANGITYVYELAEFTHAEVKAIKGVGPAAITAIRLVLAEHGMTLKGEQLAEEVAV